MIAMQPPWLVKGRVTDQSGKGLAGVEVQGRTGVGTLLGGGITATDAAGFYRLILKPGMRTKTSKSAPKGVGVQAASIFVNKPGWTEQNLCQQGDLLMTDLTPETLGDSAKPWGKNSTNDIVFLNQPKTVNFVMQPAVTLEGTLIITGRKLPIEKQRIWITGPELPPSSSVLTTLQTDEAGRLRYDHLPPGHDWQFMMQLPNSEVTLKSETIRFEESASYRFNLELRAPERGGRDQPKLVLKGIDSTLPQ